MKLSFEKKLGVLFLIFFMGIIVIGYLAYNNNVSLTNNAQWVKHTEDVLRETETAVSLIQFTETAERGYLLTNDTEFLAPIVNKDRAVFYHLGRIKDLTADNPSQQQQVDSLYTYAEKRLNFIAKCIELNKEGHIKQAADMVATKVGKNLMEKIMDISSGIKNEENRLLNQRQIRNSKVITENNRILIVLFSGLLILMLGTFLVINYYLKRRKALEKQLNESSHFLNTILENIPDMIFVKDVEQLRFIRFNRAGEKLLGHNRDELMGKNDYDLFPKDEANFFTAKDREVLNKGTLIDIAEEPIMTPEGERWLHTKKIPITDETGKPIYLLGISEDITESKNQLLELNQLNKQLEKTVAQLTQANKEMEAFTYSVSHDLRAPLRIIDGFGEILAKDYEHKLDEDGRYNLKVIMNSARHMGQLIDDLLNLSRLGRAKLNIKETDMAELVHEVVDALKLIEQNNKAQIKVMALKPAHCDPSLLRQVWINLISNAIKYSGKKDFPEIEIGCMEKDCRMVYYIRDNGVGFDMQYADKLFGVFQRLHKVSEFEGTGVGLALVHRIISKHNGSIWADAKVNEGATFYFTLA
jgi:PAS domain S-box-containing protein